jgi:hypothetical protein
MVEKYIYYGLIRNCWLNLKKKWLKLECDEFRILKWLASKGMNVECVIRSKLNPSDAINKYELVEYTGSQVRGEQHSVAEIPGSTTERRQRTKLPTTFKPKPKVDDFWNSVDWKNISYMLPTATLFNQTTGAGNNAFNTESLFPDQSSTQNSTALSAPNNTAADQSSVRQNTALTSTGTDNGNNQRRVRPPPMPVSPKAMRKTTTSKKQRRTRSASTNNNDSSQNPPKKRSRKNQDDEIIAATKIVATNIVAV